MVVVGGFRECVCVCSWGEDGGGGGGGVMTLHRPPILSERVIIAISAG